MGSYLTKLTCIWKEEDLPESFRDSPHFLAEKVQEWIVFCNLKTCEVPAALFSPTQSIMQVEGEQEWIERFEMIITEAYPFIICKKEARSNRSQF